MIFISAGTQFPFDRFIKILDDIASSVDEQFVAQAIPGHYIPKHFDLMPSITTREFEDYVRQARIVVSHAGMGTILTALLNDKPVVIFPRLASKGEHRNEHQTDTANHFDEMKYVYLAKDAGDLRRLIQTTELPPLHKIGSHASDELVGVVDDFISAAHDKAAKKNKKK